MLCFLMNAVHETGAAGAGQGSVRSLPALLALAASRSSFFIAHKADIRTTPPTTTQIRAAPRWSSKARIQGDATDQQPSMSNTASSQSAGATMASAARTEIAA